LLRQERITCGSMRGVPMELGIFIPIGNNGWIISVTKPVVIG
jgi:hypothetical protein